MGPQSPVSQECLQRHGPRECVSAHHVPLAGAAASLCWTHPQSRPPVRWEVEQCASQILGPSPCPCDCSLGHTCKAQGSLVWALGTAVYQCRVSGSGPPPHLTSQPCPPVNIVLLWLRSVSLNEVASWMLRTESCYWGRKSPIERKTPEYCEGPSWAWPSVVLKG